MLDGFEGRSIDVRLASFDQKDDYGNAVKNLLNPIRVSDVLIAPGDTTDDREDGRPNGITIAYTLYFPKSSNMKLRGAEIVIDGEAFEVVGDPRPYPPELVPGSRNLVVKVVKHDG